MATVEAIPKGYHTITPNIVVADGAKAIDFYKRAFGAEEIVRMAGPQGGVMHAELKFGDSTFMLGEAMPEMGAKSPKTLGGSPVGFYVYVADVDAAWNRAVKAGATSVMPLASTFWGDRAGRLEDPDGHSWWLAQHEENLTPEEMKKRQEAYFAEHVAH